MHHVWFHMHPIAKEAERLGGTDVCGRHGQRQSSNQNDSDASFGKGHLETVTLTVTKQT